MEQEERTIYELVGGEETFKQLVDLFYAKIEADVNLRPMFPESLEEGKHWQFLFLCQLFGGPQQYAEERGHPRLRMRHAPFTIDQKAKEAWLSHMLSSLDELQIEQPMLDTMRGYFERAATHMINHYTPNE
ncbi:MAG: globin [Anaerolineae bacterium]|jgi:hemoglobin|nr:globin [Anaerolineae bacterium]